MQLNIPTHFARRLASFVSLSVDKEGCLRYPLNAIAIDFSDDDIYGLATDGRRCHYTTWRRDAWPDAPTSGIVLIPPGLLSTLKKVKAGIDTIPLVIESDTATLTANDKAQTTTAAKLPDMAFPASWRQAARIGDDSGQLVGRLDPRGMKALIEEMQGMTTPFTLGNDGSLVLEPQPMKIKGWEPADGHNGHMAINWRYLKDAFTGASKHSTATIEDISNGGTPCYRVTVGQCVAVIMGIGRGK